MVKIPYILNKNISANFRHPDVGILPPSTAMEVSDKIANLLKHNINIIIFKKIMVKQKLMDEELKDYEDFMIEYKGDMEKASAGWKKYKEEKGL